jgi:hypothetical protein
MLKLNSIEERNIELIKKSSPQLYQLVYKDKPISDVNVTEIEGFNFIIENSDKKCFLHSIYDQENEINSVLSTVKITSDTTTLIIFGFGNGKLLKKIKNKYPHIKKIIIIEPLQDIFKSYLKENDITRNLKYFNNVVFIVNKNIGDIRGILHNLLITDPNIILVSNPSYRVLFSSYYDKLVSDLIILIRKIKYSIATLNANIHRWANNTLNNLECETNNVEELIPFFESKSIIIVSAGPSLEKNIHLLNKAKKKFIIIAVGTGIQVLENNGIEPHFRVVVDGSADQLSGVQAKNIPLIFTNQLNYNVLKKYNGPKYRMIIDTDYLGKYLYKLKREQFLEVKSGASVANVIFNFLGLINPKQIVFIGQDMCMLEDKLHANSEKHYINEENYIDVIDIYGRKAKTIIQYLSIKYDFDEQIKTFKGIEILNATEGGLGIEGVENVKLADIINNSNEKYVKSIEINQHKSKSKIFNQSLLLEAINELEVICNNLVEIANVKTQHINIKKLYLEFENLERNKLYNEVVKNVLDGLFVPILMKYKNLNKDVIEQDKKIIMFKCVETINYLKSLQIILNK